MTKLITTSVIRGSNQGESHGGIYLIDLDARTVVQTIDWDTVDIDWQGRGWDRGLRGIAFDGDTVYIAASDVLFAYTPEFELVDSWRNPYLRHCHEICVYQRTLFLTSTGFDSILAFDLDQKKFNWAMQVQQLDAGYIPSIYDPEQGNGPGMENKLHINNVIRNADGMYISGLHCGGMLHFNGRRINMVAELPPGTHNARPFRDGVLYNDSQADVLRYTSRSEGSEDRAFPVPRYPEAELRYTGLDKTGVARQAFARGLCLLSDTLVAGGSSPSTITIYDLAANAGVVSVALTMDVRNAIHGLEVWPFD
jgi:hypothetical protein